MALYAFDGTWNNDDDLDEVAATDTNVSRFLKYCDLPEEEEEYVKGVGTRFSIFGKTIGGLAGVGGKKRIRMMFKQLRENFSQGDEEIHIIGFSRGAALALHFANAIHDASLVNKDGKRVKHAKIGFMGLWDVVGAFGIPLNVILPFQKWNPSYDLDVAPNVTRCCHAMALHERREGFTVTRLNKNHADPRIEERWFRGVHSDVGGGNANTLLSNIALKWMLQKAADFELPVNANKLTGLDKEMDHTAAISKNLDPRPDPARTPLPDDLFHVSTEAVELGPGRSKSFIVGAGELYSWSGVKLVAGGRYTFSFDPDQVWQDKDIDCGPAGWTVKGEKDELNFMLRYFIRHAEDDRRHPDADWFEVIGALGKSDDHLLRIGNGSKKTKPYVCPRDATLFCFANDLKNKYGNNKGNIRITVTRKA